MTKKNTRNISRIILTLAFLLQVHAASAANVDIRINSVTSSLFEDFSEEIGLAISYLPMAPAEPLGLLGWDIGVEVSAIDIDQSLWSNVAQANPNGTVLLPRLHLQKGLPFGIDVGAIYTEVPSSNIKVIGGELKWAIVSGNAAVPALAIRGSYTQLSGVDNFDLETIGADLSVSKGFAFVTPYVGYGQVWINSEAPALNLKENISLPKPYVGVKLSVALINFVFEADFGKVAIYTGRLNFGF